MAVSLSKQYGTLKIDGDTVFKIVQSELSASVGKRPTPRSAWDDSRYEPFLGVVKRFIPEDERAQRINAKCEALRQAAACERCHLTRLDEVFSTYLHCHLEASGLSPESITKEVIAILSRLPERPPAPQSPPSSLPERYFNDIPSWETLHVASFVPRNLVRLVAFKVIDFHKGSHEISEHQSILNGVGAIIDAVCAIEVEAVHRNQQIAYEWFVVRAFLWTFWQRLNTLIRYFQVQQHLHLGVTNGDGSLGSLRHFSVRPGTNLAAFTAQLSRQGIPGNMCTWAFELIRSNPLCLGLDFQILHRRFTGAFRNIKARCQPNSDTPCEGLGPNCLRYKGASIPDQSAHDSVCLYHSSEEPKLAWDEASYRRVRGARAVSVDAATNPSASLQYCSASDTTLAISHVWIHGQGGRPEVGINHCLHQRYCRVAQQLGCDSYWMDTVSIPQNHDLRREAISQINTVFYRSRAVLVCDKDLMQVDVSNLTMPLREALMIAVLLCDWNVRAWTILEGFKGREKIHLLCKDDRTVNFKEMLQEVCREGRVDTVVFANLLPHILPQSGDGLPQSKVSLRNNTPEIAIGVAGSWLSHRPASRRDDEIVIWSLLLGDTRPPLYNAVAFWKAQSSIYTGYLLSSNPRLTDAGLSWAPSTPYAMVQQPGSALTTGLIHRPMPRSETWPALIHEDGLWGAWYVYEFDFKYRDAKGILKSLRSSTPVCRSTVDLELESIRSRLQIREKYAALLQPIQNSDTLIPGKLRRNDVIRSDQFGRLVAVCESDKKELKRKGRKDGYIERHKSYRWRWKGVYEWPENVPLPVFEMYVRLWIS